MQVKYFSSSRRDVREALAGLETQVNVFITTSKIQHEGKVFDIDHSVIHVPSGDSKGEGEYICSAQVRYDA
jgi:hypothetical protein